MTIANQATPSVFEDQTYKKVAWRIIPLLMICYIVAYLDRVNVGFAKLQMLSDLGFSEAVYGFGAGVFFFGYFIFEVPSNIILHKVGARVWIARIMVTWAVISGACMFVSTPTSFYVMRFLLGLAEAGFFPGIILYITYWFPSARRSRIISIFMTAIPLAGLVGGPLSGWIMESVAGANGLTGWQWMFGVMLCVNMQTSFMHPPFGFALFYLRGVAPKEVKSSDIYWGALPWVGLQLIMVLVVIAFPALVTTLLDKPAVIAQSKEFNFTNADENKSDSTTSAKDEDAPVVFQLDKPTK